MAKYNIRDIFLDNNNWKKHKKSHKLRREQINEVDKMLSCSSHKCVYFKGRLIRFSCNGRLCPSCGKRYVDKWAEKTCKRLQKTSHSHIVLTMPSIIWDVIKEDWNCIRELSDQASHVLKVLNKHDLGAICSIHTFGKDMKFNVHFHAIINSARIKNIQLLRILWKHSVIEVLTKKLKKTLKTRFCLSRWLYTHTNQDLM